MFQRVIVIVKVLYIKSVSYTHLDVYKRQALPLGVNKIFSEKMKHGNGGSERGENLLSVAFL